MPGSGPVSSRSCAEDAVEQRRLAGVRPPEHGDAQRLGDVELAAVLLLAENERLGVLLLVRIEARGARQDFDERVVEFAEALAVLGGERDRIAEAEAEGFIDAVAPAPPSALLAMTMIGLPARRTAGAKCRSAAVMPARASTTNRIASQSSSAVSVCARMRPASVSGSPSSRPGRVDDGEGEIGKPRLALAAVAGDARLDRRPAPACGRPAG